MKRASLLRVVAATFVPSLLLFGCGQDSNPTIPPPGSSIDAPVFGGHTMTPLPDAAVRSIPDANRDAGAKGDADALVVDAVPFPLVRVTILSLGTNEGIDGGAREILLDGGVDAGSVDGGGRAPIVVGKSSRLAPTVRVEVEPRGGDPMLEILSSVKAGLIATSGTSQVASATLNQVQFGQVQGTDNKFYLFADTPLDVSKVPPEVYDLQVVATTAGGATGQAVLRIYLDSGPSITFLQPADKAYVKGSVSVIAVVTDRRANVDSVDLSIGQYEIPPSAVTAKNGQYMTTIDFGSYNPPLDGDQMVTVTATNSNGIASVLSRKFTIDNMGPTFSSTKPAVGVLIGGTIKIEAKVDDPAGVMASSVVAVVAHGDIHFEISLERAADGSFQQLFDTTKLPTYALFPSISFRAQDVLGNQSSTGYLVSLDNTPPVLDLDPPEHLRLYKKDGTCSWPLDPVGPDAIDDGSMVTQLFDIRARIQDLGNTPATGSTDWIPISEVNPDSIRLFILDDTSIPLVVDSSDTPNGICDEINPELVPSVSPQSSKEAQVLGMVPLPAGKGTGDFRPQPGLACSGKDKTAPEPVCGMTYSWTKGKGLTYNLNYSGDNEPAIYTIAPIVSNDYECAGRQFDASNHLRDGWACVAVEASDKMGNKQVSRPVRICLTVTPGSTACSVATLGGANLTSVSWPSSASGAVVITTETPLLGNGGQPLKNGDSIVLSDVTPPPFAEINGTHTVRTLGASTTRFELSDVSASPAQLWAQPADSNDPAVLKGPVGMVLRRNDEIEVVTDLPNTSLAADFVGQVIVQYTGASPEKTDPRWSARNIQPTGFKLVGSPSRALGGQALAASKLPNCTGTLVKQGSGVAPVVDATKPCRPWMEYPEFEGHYIE